YGPVTTSHAQPEFNLFVRMFLPGGGISIPTDQARTEFNLFLRYLTTTIALFLALCAAGTAAEVLGRERSKETWYSLLATPLSAREILRGTILSAVWRLRGLIAIPCVLWTVGLLCGAVHPLGLILALLELAASSWFFLALGAIGAVRAK